MLRNILARANKFQKFVLVTTVLSRVFVTILTWYMVVYLGAAKEAASITRYFVLHYGTLGLLAISVAYIMGFLVSWVAWVRLSRGRSGFRNWNRPIIAGIACGFSMLLFVGALFNFANDAVGFMFNSNILLSFLRPPWYVIPTLLAIALTMIQILKRD